MDFPFSFDPYIGVLTLNTRFCGFSVNLVRKPEGVGVRGQGKVAFSHALWLPLPREQSISPSIIRQQGGSLPNSVCKGNQLVISGPSDNSSTKSARANDARALLFSF